MNRNQKGMGIGHGARRDEMGDRTRNARVCWPKALRRWQALPVKPHLITGLSDDPEGKGQMRAIRSWWKFDTPSHPAAKMNA